jgi:hypothetical protein
MTTETQLRDAERAYHAEPTTANADLLERLRARARPVVRVEGSFGFGCTALGELVRQTARGYTYRDEAGRLRNVRMRRKPRFSGEGWRTVHLVACHRCKDAINSTIGPGYCIHGTKHDGPYSCERCACM